MISLIMEGKFLQIEPVKYLQLARLFFFFLGTGRGREKAEMKKGAKKTN